MPTLRAFLYVALFAIALPLLEMCLAITVEVATPSTEAREKSPQSPAARPDAVEIGREPLAKLDYTIRYQSRNDEAKFRIVLTATGHLGAGGLVCKLANWGEWTSAPFSYLRRLKIDGHPMALSDSGTCAIPPALLADQRLNVTYDLVVQPAGSAEHEKRPLLPYRDDHHVFAFAINTLMDLTLNDAPLPSDVTIRIDAPRKQKVFTGWAGLSAGDQTSRVSDRLPSANGVFAIGRVFAHTTEEVNGTVLEVVQFARVPDAVERVDAVAPVAEVARTMIAAFSNATGRGPRGPVRILIERSPEEGVHRGTHTDAGLVVELPGTLPLSDFAKELIAHELFHDWLGSQLVGDDSLVWFSEGFTDYFALWHAAANGLTSPARFADRILSIEREARSSSSLGRLTFADTGTNWRDGNGPNETMAYRGGALLAFAVDAELRQRHGQTVSAVVHGLFQSTSGTYQLADIHDVFAQLGIGHLYERSIAGKELPNAFPLLTALGFDETEETASLTYLGIEARGDVAADSVDIVPAIVTAIDSTGPAAKAGLLPGDRIVAYGTQRSHPPKLGTEAPQHYRFGLNMIPSGAKSVPLDILRDGQTLQVEVVPVLVPGGRRVRLKWNPDRRTGFFNLVPVQSDFSRPPGGAQD